MYKNLKKGVALVCALVMMLTGFPSASAAYGPSAGDLDSIGSQIEYPKESEYWSDYGYGMVNSRWDNDSVYCYGTADHSSSKFTVSVGADVVVLAERGDMFCVLITSQNKARWINKANIRLYDEGELANPRSLCDKYNNPITVPGDADLEEIGSEIEYPKKNDYRDEYSYGTVRAPKGHSVYCYGSADRLGSSYIIPDGEEVVVLASRGEMLCVMIPSQNKARWIKDIYVVLEPAKSQIPTAGEGSEGTVEKTAGNSWVEIQDISLVDRKKDGSVIVDIEVAYSWGGEESAQLDILYDSKGQNRFFFLPISGSLIIDPGEGSHVFRVHIPNPGADTMVTAQIDPYPHPMKWSPFAHTMPQRLPF